MSRLYPVMLRLEGQSCVVIGGGEVAARKVARLLDAGAIVTLIAPSFAPALESLARQAELTLLRRAYRRGDLARAVLAIASTDSRAVNSAVAAEAGDLGIPVNVVDDPLASTFQVPAVVEREGLVVAVSTGGRSPAFARRLRFELEDLLSPERLALLALYAEVRTALADRGVSAGGAAWAAVDDRALELLREGRGAEARLLVESQVLATQSRGIS